jgi:parvulin-like peptidyl-prolyl cis-trans isomerase-like protein
MTARNLLPPLLAALLAVSCREGRAPDPVILELDDQVVRRSEFDRHLAEVEARGGEPLSPEVRQGILESFLEQRVLVLEARKRGLVAPGAPPAEEQRAVSELLSRTVPAPTVSDEEIAAFYRDRLAEMSLPETVTVRQILVGSLNEARDVRRRLAKTPKDFENVARQASRGPEAASGGLMGTFARGQLPAELEAAAFALTVGGTSEIVETSLGYHILRVDARQDARVPALEEAQGRIRAVLAREKSDRNVRQFVADLLARAKVNHAAATRLSSAS